MLVAMTPTAINAALSKMDQDGIPMQDRESVFTIAAARCFAYQLPINPDVRDPYAEFNSRYYMDVEKAAGVLNETIVLNIADVVELTRRIWVFRYRIVYDPMHPSVSELIDALIKCGAPEITKRASNDMIKYSDHVVAADALVRPIVVSMQRR